MKRCILCGRKAGKYYICRRCDFKRKAERVLRISVAVAAIIVLCILICGFIGGKYREEAPEVKKIEFQSEGYVLQYGDNLWTLYEEYGEGISWEKWQSEMYRRNEDIGSFMREGEEIKIVFAK